MLGPDEGPLGLRGDAIRLWETRDSLVEGNEVAGSRDVVAAKDTVRRVASRALARTLRPGSALPSQMSAGLRRTAAAASTGMAT